MKNIHVLPTDKPSRLADMEGLLVFGNDLKSPVGHPTMFLYRHIYITSDEEIKEDDWVICWDGDYKNIEVVKLNKDNYTHWIIDSENYKKISLTTDQDLIKDGVQAIDDEFLEWFVKNPSCDFVEVESFIRYNPIVYQIILPKPKQETLEEFINSQPYYGTCTIEYKEGIEVGAKWQADRMYSEEEISMILQEFKRYLSFGDEISESEWFEQFKKKQ